MKYWVFDLDGTLVDSHGVYFDSLRWALEQHGFTFREEDKADALRTPARGRQDFFVRRVGADHAEAVMATLSARLQNDHELIRTFAGIPDMLEEFRERGVPMALWTARELESAHTTVEITGIKKYFSFILSGSCMENCKPAPDGLLHLAQKFGCDPGLVTMVGDHDNDMMAARASGAHGVRVHWHLPSAFEKCAIAEHQFLRVDEFRDWALKR